MNFILQHIHAEMDRLGLSARNRSLHIQFSDPVLNLQLFLQRIDAEHALNAGLKADITAEDGQAFEGVSGEDGKTDVCTKDVMAALNIEVFPSE